MTLVQAQRTSLLTRPMIGDCLVQGMVLGRLGKERHRSFSWIECVEMSLRAISPIKTRQAMGRVFLGGKLVPALNRKLKESLTSKVVIWA